ncbi:MAG: GGDEF domain-containing protein [Pseudomonadota bacterium]
MQLIRAVQHENEGVDVADLARRAVDEAIRRGVPPDPRAFAVFYAHLSGASPELSAALEAEAPTPAGRDDAPTRLSLDALDRLHELHLYPAERGGRILDLGVQMEQELQAIASSLSRRSESDGEFMDQLEKARDGMSLFARPSNVRQILRDLIDTSEVHAEQTQVFAGELEVARAQIDELSAELKAVRESAYVDHLTGLANRRRWDRVAGGAADDRNADPTLPAFSMVICDLDRFKRVNDTFGHNVGDSVIRQFAQTVRLGIKGKDTAARYGGEEFALLLPETQLLGARHVAEKIRQAFAAQAFVVSDTQQRVGALSASFGVAEHRPGETIEALAARADAALYRAKNNGRNRVSAAD